MTDAELARRLAHVHQTLELIALLLAVAILDEGTVGLVVGGAAILLLVGNAVFRALE